MIRRAAAGGWDVILQTDHAELAGRLAAAWAEAPEAGREEALFGIAHHDDGWIEWERRPEIDPDDHGPRPFTQMATDQHLEIWHRGGTLHAGERPFAALLILGHNRRLTSFYRHRAARVPALADKLDVFLAETALLQRSLERLLEARLATRLALAERPTWQGLLWICDALSLALCGAEVGDTISAEPWPSYQLAPLGEDRYRLTPYPFSGSPLTLSLRSRRLEAECFVDSAALQAALASAPWLDRSIEIHP
ncbi:MAG TPA: DUF3891 family protein [Acidobacteriota bacterium]